MTDQLLKSPIKKNKISVNDEVRNISGYNFKNLILKKVFKSLSRNIKI